MIGADAAESRSLGLRAPAKINLGLRVTGRRADGYHELDSVMLPLDLADEVTLELRAAREPRVTLRLDPDVAGVPSGAANLTVRAAELFLERSGVDRSVAIRLTKRIPAAAGLGGG